MIRISEQDVAKWRLEIEQGEKFRDDELGKNTYSEVTKAGENIDYFENGVSGRLVQDYNLDLRNVPLSTINVIFPIVKNVIPTLYWKNPYIVALPKRSQDEDSAPYAGALLNYYYEELDIKNINRQIIFDAYVIGQGVCKVGYTTKFGTIPSEESIKQEQKERRKNIIQKTKEMLGLAKPKEEKEVQNPELNEYIRSESPYVVWVNPFDFIIDPMANSIETARWVAQRITKLLKNVKEDSNYSNTSNLEGSPVPESITKKVPETQIDDFKTIDLYEIHYKTDEGINILILAKDGSDYKALRHEKSPYEMDGFQYEILTFNKHNHRLYPKSDIDIVKGLQDRIALTFDSILDQIDKYVPKIFVDETALTAEGSRTLRDGEIGAIVKCNKNPNEIVKEASFQQLKGDLSIFIDKTLEVIMLETGLTKTQLMGMSNAQTATEAQIEQSGQNLRISDKFDLVASFATKQARKLWQVIQQFVDMQEVELITGEKGIDDVTGLPKFDWLKPIDSVLEEKLIKGEYKFRIEISSMEKPDLPVLRSQVERIAGLIAQQGVMEAFQLQGYKINLAEFAKRYLQLFPYVFPDIGKIIQPIGPNTTGLIPPQLPQPTGGMGKINTQNSPQPPNIADILSGQAGEKGMGIGIA
jgi:hypothetical protein